MLHLMADENLLQIHFGRRIRQLRNEHGMSQEQLALKTGLDRTYISGIERGLRNPSLQIISKLAKALSISLPDIFTF
jgi:transcriptional regulator with XRE-family HTH domain